MQEGEQEMGASKYVFVQEVGKGEWPRLVANTAPASTAGCLSAESLS